MLHGSDAHLVAFAQDIARERSRHDIERLARVAAHDGLVAVGDADMARQLAAGVVDGGRGLDREVVQAAQGVGVEGLVETRLRVDDATGSLRGGRAVEKCKVAAGCEQREVGLVGVFRDVARFFDGYRHAGHGSSSSFVSSAPSAMRSTARRHSSSGQAASADSSTERENNASAASGERPRLAR